ncbi:NAD(P)-binding protein [Hypoxylon rubiginosum]|uniref:NAD(P)-binding protein n=1 Tax=Hypoxylon rubiginosum TaxID=110542 RepID=A0ACB9Z820_9PEZI|nr:NAD(P)-binding protein [Hypoxylon rubiginosum]
MPSYVITGVSKGLGWEFLRLISSDSNNLVVGIVRDKPTTDKRVSEELKGRTNVHILQADVTNYDILKKAAVDASDILGGSLDYLIANAGLVSSFDAYDPIGDLGSKPKELEANLLKMFNVNVVANIHLYNLFMPLILKGSVKKVVTISSGLADTDLTNQYDLTVHSLYAITKAALNMMTAKFNAQYKKDGVLFLSLCPGMADVGHYKDATPEQLERVGGMTQKFAEYSPHFTGPTTPDAAVKDVVAVWEKCSLENGDGGAFLSHFGNKQWL